MTHTPGPWRIETGGGSDPTSHVYADDPNGCAADGDLVTIADLIENEANARLIAAAPDLLAACKKMRQIASAQFGLNEANAAIAKAEGR